jgi:hypothetical protein
MLAYGYYHYKGKTTEGDWFHIGLASNKRYISLYVMATDDQGYVTDTFRSRLPRADIGKSCVRFARLSDLDQDALRDLIEAGAKFDPVAISE